MNRSTAVVVCAALLSAWATAMQHAAAQRFIDELAAPSRTAPIERTVLPPPVAPVVPKQAAIERMDLPAPGPPIVLTPQPSSPARADPAPSAPAKPLVPEPTAAPPADPPPEAPAAPRTVAPAPTLPPPVGPAQPVVAPADAAGASPTLSERQAATVKVLEGTIGRRPAGQAADGGRGKTTKAKPVADGAAAAKAGQPAAPRAPTASAQPASPTPSPEERLIVHFPGLSAALDGFAEGVVEQAAQRVGTRSVRLLTPASQGSLGRNRAEAVKQYLVELGVPVQRIGIAEGSAPTVQDVEIRIGR